MGNKKYEWYGELVTKEEYDKLYEEYIIESELEEKMRLKALDSVAFMQSYIKSDIESNQDILNDNEYEDDEKEQARQDIKFLNRMLDYIYKIQMENACQDC